jgi:hypothetical protein
MGPIFEKIQRQFTKQQAMQRAPPLPVSKTDGNGVTPS